MVQVLLERGANAHALDYGGWTALQLPSQKGHLSVVRIVLADANTRDNSNWTPLHGASQQGHLEVVRVLLEHGADANSRDNSNQTSLHLASGKGYLEIVRLLVEHSANIHVRNEKDRTAFQKRPWQDMTLSCSYYWNAERCIMHNNINVAHAMGLRLIGPGSTKDRESCLQIIVRLPLTKNFEVVPSN